MGAKAVATVLGGLCFVIAIAINSTGTEKFGMIELKETVSVTVNGITFNGVEFEVFQGIWLGRTIVTVNSKTEEEDPSPVYCDEDEDSGNCAAGKDSDCCKALASKCKARKAFGVLAAVCSLFGTITGILSRPGGAIFALLTALSFLIVFAVTSSVVEGEFQSDGAPNKDADCGIKDTLFQGQTVNFNYAAGFGISVVGSFLALVQSGCYFAAFESYTA